MIDLATSPLASREWRLQHLYTIRNKQGGLVAFTPNAAQRDYYNHYWFCNHTLKARQLGFSTWNCLIFLDDLLFSPTGLRCGVIDYTIEDAEQKLQMMRCAYENMDNPEIHPDTWQLGKAIKTAIPAIFAARKITFGNGSTVRASTSMRGSCPQRVLISELGKTAIWAPIKAREIISGAFNAIAPGSIRNIESTHEGARVGDHYRLLKQSMAADPAKLSPIQSRFHFYPWYLDPTYTLPTQGFRLRPEMVRYFELLQKDHGLILSPEQMLWYDHKHLEQGYGMKKEFPTTAGEAFEAIADGSIYGTQMADLRAAGRIRDFAPEAGPPIFTFWDIGLSDYTAVWLIQPVGRFFLVLDWFESEGRPGSAMPDFMRLWETKWNRPIAAHFLPHDANTRDPGDGKSYVQTLHAGGLRNLKIVPRTPDVWLGIGYVRDVLPHCWFNAGNTDIARNLNGSPHAPDDSQEDFPSGVACLEGYSKDTGAAAGMRLREMPKHDLFSHSADAFRTFAEAHARNLIQLYENDAPKKPATTGGVKPHARR